MQEKGALYGFVNKNSASHFINIQVELENNDAKHGSSSRTASYCNSLHS